MTVVGRLQPPFVARRALRGVDGDGIAGRGLVDVRHAVADPLAPRIHRHAHVQLDLAHLERRGVGVPQQIADEAPIS